MLYILPSTFYSLSTIYHLHEPSKLMYALRFTSYLYALPFTLLSPFILYSLRSLHSTSYSLWSTLYVLRSTLQVHQRTTFYLLLSSIYALPSTLYDLPSKPIYALRSIIYPLQEIIKVREWIPHIGPLTKVIPLKLLLSSSVDITRALRGHFRGGSVYVSFCFVSMQRKTSNAVGLSSLVSFWLQAKELRLSVCFTLRNLARRLKKRRMFPAQTITTEWTTEKWEDKRVQSKQMLKHKLGNRTNRWSKVREEARCPSSRSSLSSDSNNAKGNIDL